MTEAILIEHDGLGYCRDCATSGIEEAEDSISDIVQWIKEMREALQKASA